MRRYIMMIVAFANILAIIIWPRDSSHTCRVFNYADYLSMNFYVNFCN